MKKMKNNHEIPQKETRGYLLILGYLGTFLVLVGILLLIPLIMIPFDYDNSKTYLWQFLLTGLISVSVGAVLYFLLIFRRKQAGLKKYQDTVLMVALWIMVVLVSAIPLATSKIEGMNYLTSVFEMVSGYTTTGATAIVDVDTFPRIFLFQRVLIQAFGGIGLVLIISTAFNGSIGVKLFKVEGHNETLLPNLMKTARIVVLIYLILITVGTGAFALTGMNFFESLSFSIACISTGGFSVLTDNIHQYNNLAIEIIAMCLMLVGSTSFFILLAFSTGKFKKIIQDDQTIAFVIIIVVVPLLLSLTLTPSVVGTTINNGELGITINNYGDALRYTAFQVISATTTTGLVSIKAISALPEGMLAVMTLLIIIGGCSGSTASGIKISRLVVLAKGVYFNLKERLGNKRIITTHYIRKHGTSEIITNETLLSTVGYVLVYVTVIGLGTLLLSLVNPSHAFGDSFFDAASLTSGVGFGLVITSIGTSAGNLWIAMGLMLIGRLEIITIFVAIYCVIRDISQSINDLRKRKIRGDSANIS